MKITGKEFKEFMKSDWGHHDAYMEDEEILVDGASSDAIILTEIPDTSKVEIRGGMVYVEFDNREGKPLLSILRSWKKAQSTDRILVEFDKSKRDAIISAIKNAGGKVL